MTNVPWALALKTVVLAFALSGAAAPALAQTMSSEELIYRPVGCRDVGAQHLPR